ncbi:17565_t:CDS:2 [Gigaspora rosea]|nr:17565_t:CDS:2 [Gigaspora rosea]
MSNQTEKNNMGLFLDKVEKNLQIERKQSRRCEFVDKEEKRKRLDHRNSLKHLKNMIAPEKKISKKKELEIEHVTLTEIWDVYLIQNLAENREKQQELTQALEKN